MKRHTHHAIIRAILLAYLWLAACVPTQTPPQLAQTPGPQHRIGGDSYHSEAFDVRIPEGWRIITGSAAFPQSLTLVSPDNCAIILITMQAGSQPPISQTCARGSIRTREHRLVIGQSTLSILGSAPTEAWQAFIRTVDAVEKSIAASSAQDADS